MTNKPKKIELPTDKELKDKSLLRLSEDLWRILLVKQAEDKTGLVELGKKLELVLTEANMAYSEKYNLMVEPMSNLEVYVKQGGKFEKDYSLKVSNYLELI